MLLISSEKTVFVCREYIGMPVTSQYYDADFGIVSKKGTLNPAC